MMHELRLAFIALQFFTRVPVPKWVGFEPEWLHQSARHFSLIGILVGAVAAAVLWGSSQMLPLPVAVLLSMASTMWLTGGFHEDGWADTCDGLGGTVSRERALEIMKDSRIGAYGAMGLLMMLALKAAALASLPAAWGCAALLLGHTASRAASTSLICFLPYAGDLEHAKAKPLAQRMSPVGLLVSCGWVLLIAVGLALVHAPWRVPVAAALLAVIVGAAWCARWFRRRLGGVTGDTLGAAQQLTELLLLLTWSAVWQAGLGNPGA
ncbi:MAG: adenosylcobinamide-GDP ribazoletransferase [Burkholderiales bacterium PBB1]|nr:MAG: adenosylcobinamide-GDP ribazoletransferase [Burkholderiales bacterium PBB1]